jgi:hypothetical protein
MNRRVPNVMGNKSKIPFHELGKHPASEIMKSHNLNTKQFVQEVRKHAAGDGKSAAQELTSFAYKRHE